LGTNTENSEEEVTGEVTEIAKQKKIVKKIMRKGSSSCRMQQHWAHSTQPYMTRD